MQVINPFLSYRRFQNQISCFLAGGMRDTSWYDKVLACLAKKDTQNLVIFNPYNADYNKFNEDQFLSQVVWEISYIELCDIFSVYFDKHTSQPTSMFELGMMIHTNKPCVISLHKDACNEKYLKLSSQVIGKKALMRSPEEHAEEIFNEYLKLKK